MTLPTIHADAPLVIATHNPGKLVEIGKILAPFISADKVLSAGSLGLPEPVEDGATFADNAAIKSRAAAMASGHMALADDSGLEVDVLGGYPGIYSARLAGADKDFGKAMEAIRQKLEEEGHAPQGALARFVCVLSLCNPEGQTIEFYGEVEGKLTFPPCGEKGFGYDPIFVPSGFEETFAQMEPEKKHQMSHRARAFSLLVDHLNKSE